MPSSTNEGRYVGALTKINVDDQSRYSYLLFYVRAS